MVKQLACPADADLKRLAAGELAVEATETLARHLEACASCLEKVQTMAPSDTLVNSLPLARKASATLTDTGEVAGLIGKLKTMAGAPLPTDAINFACVCGKKLKVKAELAGKKVKCPGCGKVASVPAMPQAAPAVSAEDRTVPPDEKLSLSKSESAAASNDQTESHMKSDDDEAWDFLAPAQTADEIGRLGGYRILEVLGRGGMGVVFRAEDPNLKRIVALKAMLPSLAASPSAKKRFLREAQTAASIKHDHIVTIHQVGEDRGAPFLAMEFLHGEPLDVRLKREEKLSIPEVLRIGRETAEGLAAAHDRGLIHRDIKPGNVWLEKKEEGRRTKDEKNRAASTYRVKILDFGLARSTDDQTGLTQSGAIIGTPAYMAPEQGNGGAVDHRCDLFSLGCMLYALTTGKLPFSGKDTLSILMAIATKDPKPPIEWNPAMPRELSDLILKLLEKDANDRPTDAHEVAERLSALADTISAVPSTTLLLSSGERPLPDSAGVRTWNKQGASNQGTDASRSPGRRRTFLLLGALGILAIVALGIVFFLPAGNGTIRVEINSPDIEVTVGTKGVTIKGTEKQGDIVVAAGEHSLKVKRDNLEFETDKIVLKKGEVVTVKVEWLNNKLAAIGKDGASLGSAAPPVQLAVGSGAGKSALRLNPGDTVEIPNVPVRATTVGTMEVWVKIDSIEGSVNRKILDMPSGRLRIDHYTLSYYTHHAEAEAPVHVVRGKGRVHIAGVNDGKERRLYVNGQLVATKEGAGGVEPKDRFKGTAPITLGESQLGATYDAVRISTVPRYDRDFTPPADFAKDNDTFALYRFDEGQGNVLNDSSGNGYHGKIQGGKWLKSDGAPSAAPRSGNLALRFDGQQRVDIPNLKLPTDSPYTMEGYFHPDADKVGGVDNHAMGIPAQSHLSLTKNGDWRWAAPKSADTKAGIPGISTKPRPHHIACVYDGKQRRVYVEGQQVGKSTSAPEVAANRTFVLGGSYFGTIDEVRVSKVARYNANFTPPARFEPDADTLALYHCDEGQGDKLVDSSGNGHHGSMVGAKWVKADGTAAVNPPTPNLALRFDGTQRVDIASLKLPTDSAYTMEGYFFPDEDSLGGPDSCVMGIPYHSHLGYTKGGQWRWQATKSGNPKMQIHGLSVRPGRQHIACVYDGKLRRVYIDGQLSGRPASPGETSTNKPFELGSAFFGTIDEVRVSKVARYTADFTPVIRFEPDAETLALYHCDEGQGDKLVDSSGNGHHGKIVGAKWVKVDAKPPEPAPPAVQYALERTLTSQDIRVPSLVLDLRGPLTVEGYVTTNNKLAPSFNNSLLAWNDASLAKGKAHLFVINCPDVWSFNFMAEDPEGVVNRSVFPLIPGKNTHVALVCTDRDIRLFVDGELAVKKDVSKLSFEKRKGTFGIGHRFAGLISEVRVSRVARYDKGFTPAKRFEPDEHTLALYHFDEGQGDTVKDASGNGNHFKVADAKWVKVDETKIAPVLTVTHADRLAFLEWLGKNSATPVAIEQGGKRSLWKGKKNAVGPAGPFTILKVDLKKLTPNNVAVPLSDDDMIHIASFPEIQSLNLGRRVISTAGIAQLARMTELRRLSLTAAKVPLESAEIVRGLSLEYFSPPTPEWIKALAGMPSIRTLSFFRSLQVGKFVAGFKEFPNLAVLDFAAGALSEDSLLQLRDVKSLRLLNLKNVGGIDSDTIMRVAKALPNCEIRHSVDDEVRIYNKGKADGLKVELEEPDEPDVDPVPTVTHADRLAFLEWFSQEKATYKSIDIEQNGTVFPLKGKTPAGPFLIRRVGLRHGKEDLALTDEDMARIAAIPEIQELNLSHRILSEAGMAHLARMTELRKLHLGNAIVPLESAKVLRGLPKLESLHFPKATDTWIESLAGMPSLRFFQFYRQPVSDSALARFKDFPGLAAVQFKECKVSEAGLQQLKEVKSLRLLILEKKGGSGNDADAYKRLAQALPECEIRDGRGKNATIYNKGKADGLKIEPEEPDESMVYLDELTEKSFLGFGPLRKPGMDQFAKEWVNTFAMPGDPPAHALIIHPAPQQEGNVVYDLGGRYATFQAAVRCAKNRGSPLHVEVFGDGRSLAKTENLAKVKDTGAELKVDIRGVKELKIVIDADGKTMAGHALLLDPRLTPAASAQASPPAKLGD